MVSVSLREGALRFMAIVIDRRFDLWTTLPVRDALSRAGREEIDK